MKGDFTRTTFRRERHFSRVLQQQGRVQLDADWNEALDIIADQERTALQDVIGRCCVPKGSNAFQISVAGNNLQIAEGRAYVDGILCQNEQDRPFDDQDDLPTAELPTANGRFIAYLDVWERHVTALEDSLLQEAALGGPDTATRTQVLAQVKLLPAAATTTCDDLGQGWRPTPLPTGALRARAQPSPEQDEACIIPPTAGYRRLENQLYRVEIFDAGTVGTATYMFSRENGSVVTQLLGQSGANRLIVADLGRDENLGFRSGDWVEITDDDRELANRRGIVARIQVEGDELVIDAATVDDPDDPAATGVDLTTFGSSRKVRRWDSEGLQTVSIAADNDGFLQLEDGVEVRFSNGSYQSGDYWQIAARTNLGDVLWPEAGGQPLAVSRHGIEHHYCPLAIVDRAAGNWTVVEDCRCQFPALSDIDADDVGFDNSNCLPDLAGAETVQQAIEILCRTNGGHCTFTVGPGVDLQAIFDAIPDGGDAQICFAIGDYDFADTAVARNKGALVLSGSGAGTRLRIGEQEAVLRFEGCRSVTVEQLAAASEAAELQQGNSLLGVLSFFDCDDVSVEQATISCAAGSSRRASCIRVHNRNVEADNRSVVRIRHCRLTVGHLQTGILLTNVWRSTVEDNVIQTGTLSADFTIPNLSRDLQLRGRLRSLLVGNVQVDPPQRAGVAARIDLNIGPRRILFDTAPQLGNPNLWQALIRREGVGNDTPQRAIQRVADRLLLGQVDLAQFPEFRNFLRQLQLDNVAVAGQGIVVGGRLAGDVRILNNTIERALQGIHVGVSHRESQRGTPDLAGNVLIRANTILVSLPSTATRERHAIFVGNSNSVVVDDNTLALQRFNSTSRLRVEAIRLFGQMGNRMLAHHNHTTGFNVGIRVNPLNALGSPRQPLWRIANNVATVQVTVDNTNLSLAQQQARIQQSNNLA